MYSTSPKPSQADLPFYYESQDYISHTDGKRGLFEKVYQIVKGITLSRKQKMLHSYCPSRGSVLDIGSGTGEFVAHLNTNDWQAQGMEPNAGARKLSIEKGVPTNSSLDEVTASFNVITMWHVLEHVYDLQEQITWLKQHLSQQGFLFIAVPNFESEDAKHYKEHWAAYDVPRHLSHFSQKAIELLFEEQGFELVKTHPMKFDAYYVSLLSEKYKTGKMNFLSAGLQGWKSNRAARKNGEYSSLVYVLKPKYRQ